MRRRRQIRGFEPGYYWAREDDGTHFVVLLEYGEWYCCGVENPINSSFNERQIIIRIQPLMN